MLQPRESIEFRAARVAELLQAQDLIINLDNDGEAVVPNHKRSITN